MSSASTRSKIFADGPIITSLLDTDFYKETMLQPIWMYYRDVPVRWRLIIRTPGVSLPEFVPEESLREEIEHVRTLRFTEQNLQFLDNIVIREKKIFRQDFLEALADFRLPEVELERYNDSDGIPQYRIEVAGPWYETSPWETYLLSIVTELRCRGETIAKGLSEVKLLREAERRINEKISMLLRHPRTSTGELISLLEFGTRRRLSGIVQDRVIESFLERASAHLIGTSNILRAQRYVLDPLGTFGHEEYQVLYGVARANGFTQAAHIAQRQVLDLWWRMYGGALAIALTDTWGTGFFLRNFSTKHAERWRGFRLDSGDLIAVGEKILTFLNHLAQQGYPIAPETKMLLASDGMTIPSIIEFCEHFAGRIKTVGALGTNGTFDVGSLLKPWSMANKIVESCGFSAPKLSDNPAKATGDPDEIERAKREVEYEDRPAQPLVY